MSLASIPNIIPILSGKGGVGKSSVTVQLALSLCLRGYSVAILDIDLTGPSIPRLLGIENAKIRQAPGGWLPVEIHPSLATSANGPRSSASDSSTPEGTNGTATSTSYIGPLYAMSLGLLLSSRSDAVIWRGPKKTAMVGQFLTSVLWPTLDYLLIDTPPGTSDEHISLATSLLDPMKVPSENLQGAVVVTTPQAIATADVKKELSFCRKTGLKVVGVVENMAGFVCPCCGEVTNVFSKGGGEVMAREWEVPFLGSVPLDGEGWGMLIEEGKRPVYSANAATGPSVVAESVGVESEEKLGQKHDRDSEALVEKYTSCSLHPVFDRIVEKVVSGSRERTHP